ncbi:hypothetical protein LCGC14_1871740, partial [marine sediment metagenome]
DRADLDMATAEATAKQQAGMEALTRRTQEVVDKETAVQKRGEALDARENEIEGHGRTRENELRAREEAVEAQEAAVEEHQRELLQRFGLPTSAEGLGREAVLSAMALDKKVRAGAIRWVLLEEIGRTVLRDDVPRAVVEEALGEVLA